MYEMSETPSPWMAAGFFILGVFFIRHFGWKAWLVVFPGSPEVAPDVPAENAPAGSHTVDVFHFKFLGTATESFRFGPTQAFSVFACQNAPMIFFHSASGAAWACSMSSTRALVSTNFLRPSRETPGRYTSGGSEALSVGRLVQAHLRRIHDQTFASELTLETACLQRQRWYQEFARTEVRLEHTTGLLWTIFGIVMIASTFVGIFRLLVG
jgi:hypothetical protein